MDEIKTTTPQQMLEDAFRALYDMASAEEAQRVEDENALIGYQIKWCEKFKQTFSFVSQYLGIIPSLGLRLKLPA